MSLIIFNDLYYPLHQCINCFPCKVLIYLSGIDYKTDPFKTLDSGLILVALAFEETCKVNPIISNRLLRKVFSKEILLTVDCSVVDYPSPIN